MRRAQKKQAEDFVALLGEAHDEIKKAIDRKDMALAGDLLEQCQQGAIELGNLIEKAEENVFSTITLLQDYCELAYQIYNKMVQGQVVNRNKIHRVLNKQLSLIDESVEKEIPVRIEAVFLPYKVSMWDSLESVWMAADADENCDAYVIPIPYYDKNSDGSLRTMHYEGTQYPNNVPITWYKEYDFEKRRPDVIFIHNPYDDWNYVTSVHPFFYSQNLKQFTDLLVYVPYYSITGNMSEAQMKCRAYYNADYIIIQAEKYRKFFDSDLPEEKLLALGSPKFDRVIRMCNNPPEPPVQWKEKLAGKKIYFYNTSINGMLGDTQRFLKKMDYVFRCFHEREDACLIWRPHPLLESTFDSMRKSLKPVYDQLKIRFIENAVGIYDDTPDMTNTIALCDAYVGDASTSVTSLFGITGKPLLILNNNIDSEPQPDDWRGEILKGFFCDGPDDWMITQRNKLYHSPKGDYCYRYYCDLPEPSKRDYYLQALEIEGKVYVCPASAQELLIIEDREIRERIPLEYCLEQEGAFTAARKIGNYLFFIPFRYPSIVRYDISRKKVDYIRGYNNVFTGVVDRELRIGGNCIWKHYLMLASPSDNRILRIDSISGETTLLQTGGNSICGCINMVPDGDNIWLLPYQGRTITCWNPDTGAVREYSDLPDKFQCKNRPHGYECQDRPFSIAAIYKNYIILPPFWGNMFLILDKETGDVKEWEPPFAISEKEGNGYYATVAVGTFIRRTDTLGEWTYRFYAIADRRMYDINLETKEYKEIKLEFDLEELRTQEAGFCKDGERFQYACEENAFNSLGSFLDGNISGAHFDRDRQIAAYEEIAANSDGTSGDKIYQFLCGKLK